MRDWSRICPNRDLGVRRRRHADPAVGRHYGADASLRHDAGVRRIGAAGQGGHAVMDAPPHAPKPVPVLLLDSQLDLLR